MKRLVIAILAASAVWFGFWIIGAAKMRGAVTTWAEARRAEGWLVEYGDFTVQGFPNRFDAHWTDLQLADPDTGLAWEMPQFMLASLSYQPRHRIAIWPPEMTIATPAQRYILKSDDLRASLRLNRDKGSQLDRALLSGTNLSLSGAQTAAVAGLRLAMDRQDVSVQQDVPVKAASTAQGDATYRIGVEMNNLSLPIQLFSDLRAAISDTAGNSTTNTTRNTTGNTSGTAPREKTLPRIIDSAKVDARIRFDAPWGLDTLNVRRPQPRHIALTDVTAKWGVMELRATGELTIDSTGTPSGSIAFKAAHWREMLRMAQSASAISPAVADALEQALGVVAGLRGNPASIDAQITIRNGVMMVGFVPIGNAPQIRLR